MDLNILVGGVVLIVFIAFGLALYFLPWFIARSLRCRHRSSIGLVNFLLGWSVLGWIAALLWAFFDDRDKGKQTESNLSDIKEVNNLLEKEAYFDALEKINLIEKHIGENRALMELKRSAITAIAVQLYGKGAEYSKNEQYAEAIECLEKLRKWIVHYPESFGMDRIKLKNFLLEMSNEFANEPSKVINSSDMALIRDKWQGKARETFKEKLRGNVVECMSSGNVVEMLIDSMIMPLFYKGIKKPGDEEYVDENCRRFGIPSQLQKPLFAFADKILNVCEDCTKFSLKTFEIEGTDMNYFKAYIIALYAISFIVEKVGNQHTDNKLKSFFGLVRPAMCILLKNRDEHFNGMSLEELIKGYEDNKEKYEKMDGLTPEDNPDNAYDTVLGKSTALVAQLVGGINFKNIKNNKKAVDQLLEVTLYWQSKVDPLGETIEQFLRELLELAKK